MKNYGLELYKLITNPDGEDSDIHYVSEFGWINDNEFIVWIENIWFKDFMDELEQIFGYDIYDDGGIDATIMYNAACIDLCEVLSDYLNIEEVFPKDKYRH